jgi:hypothetical protein
LIMMSACLFSDRDDFFLRCTSTLRSYYPVSQLPSPNPATEFPCLVHELPREWTAVIAPFTSSHWHSQTVVIFVDFSINLSVKKKKKSRCTVDSSSYLTDMGARSIRTGREALFHYHVLSATRLTVIRHHSVGLTDGGGWWRRWIWTMCQRWQLPESTPAQMRRAR